MTRKKTTQTDALSSLLNVLDSFEEKLGQIDKKVSAIDEQEKRQILSGISTKIDAMETMSIERHSNREKEMAGLRKDVTARLDTLSDRVGDIEDKVNAIDEQTKRWKYGVAGVLALGAFGVFFIKLFKDLKGLFY